MAVFCPPAVLAAVTRPPCEASMKIGQYETHPAADSFPMMDEGRYADLVVDIREHGQIEPITLCDGMLLDGRNRYRVCVELGIAPKTRTYDGDPWVYAWSMNGQRRDLVAEQRHLIWKHCRENSVAFQAERCRIAEEANRKRSEAAQERTRTDAGTFEPVVDHNAPPLVKEHKTREWCALMAGVSTATVARGDALIKHRPDLAAAVRKGEVKPAEAHRRMKRDEVKGKTAALPDDKFVVIYADPPWEYSDGRTGDLMTATGATHHYPTMALSELKALNVPGLAADDSVLFLWATCPLLEDALELCRAWGFKYKAQFCWDKIKHNMGHYNSVRHELLLICTRGSCTPQNVKLFDSVQSIERTAHSAKPEEFRAIIDTLYPVGNRIELFRRGDAPEGWQTWGNEV